jgi:hypothetical protein
MKDACEGMGSVSWLRPDMGYPMPPLGPQYGAIMVERVKKGAKKSLRAGSWVKMEYLYIDEQNCLVCRRWLTVVTHPLIVGRDSASSPYYLVLDSTSYFVCEVLKI